jgi:hypothetical protein
VIREVEIEHLIVPITEDKDINHQYTRNAGRARVARKHKTKQLVVQKKGSGDGVARMTN